MDQKQNQVNVRKCNGKGGTSDFHRVIAQQMVPSGTTRYGVVIGIEKYQDTRLNLRYARADAMEMHKLMVSSECGLFAPENVRLLLDDEATRDGVWRVLAHLRKKAGKQDTVWIYFAGHAVPEGNEVYWVTYDAEVDDLYGTALGDGQLKGLFDHIVAERFVVFLDCCHAAAIGLRKEHTRDFVSREIMIRSYGGKGRLVISASDITEKSVELSQYGHGAFTYYLLRGLQGEADQEESGVVTAEGLWQYLENRVSEASRATGKPQTPVLIGQLTHRMLLTMNPKVCESRKKIAEEIHKLVGIGSDLLSTAEGELCMELLKRGGLNDEERKVLAELTKVIEGRLPINIFRMVLKSLTREEFKSSFHPSTTLTFNNNSYVICSRCGKRVAAEETFRCVECERDHLCMEHYVKQHQCCETCVNIQAINRATKENPWTNSVGMKFVPIENTTVLFCIWPTRVMDYQVFIQATRKKWTKPDFEQGLDHPVVMVSWEEAQAFCQWLTKKERKSGLIGLKQAYRLPADNEWSIAVGLPREYGKTPEKKDCCLQRSFPWGKKFPPPKGAGNYHYLLKADDYPHTSPVGSFQPNTLGIFDMGGNVWEWCEDFYNSKKDTRVLRGASWKEEGFNKLLSSSRLASKYDTYCDSAFGFRVVLETDLQKSECPYCQTINYFDLHQINIKCCQCAMGFTLTVPGDGSIDKIECPFCEQYLQIESKNEIAECLHCREKFTLGQDREFIGAGMQCPYCAGSFYTELSNGTIKCPKCQKEYTIDKDRLLIGRDTDCPYCKASFYTEAHDESVECPHCASEFTIDEDGFLVGDEIKCPYCMQSFYTEALDESVECLHCEKVITLDENGFLVGDEIKCPHCKQSLYTEARDESAECPHCEKEFKLNEDGILVGDDVECPHCKQSFYTEARDESVGCPHCKKEFTLNENGNLVGDDVKCPYCKQSLYTEARDESAECPHCEKEFKLNEGGILIGDDVECPHCKQSFYTEVRDASVECSYCQKEFTLNENGNLVGDDVECPHCKQSHYTEARDESVECRHCEKVFTLDKEGKVIGCEIKCPYCSEKFYTEAREESIKCLGCSEEFTIDYNGKVIGSKIECPFCDHEFYSEERDNFVACPSCSKSIRVGHQGEPIAKSLLAKMKTAKTSKEWYSLAKEWKDVAEDEEYSQICIESGDAILKSKITISAESRLWRFWLKRVFSTNYHTVQLDGVLAERPLPEQCKTYNKINRYGEYISYHTSPPLVEFKGSVILDYVKKSFFVWNISGKYLHEISLLAIGEIRIDRRSFIMCSIHSNNNKILLDITYNYDIDYIVTSTLKRIQNEYPNIYISEQ